MRALALVVLLVSSTAAADRPTGWLFRATGLGLGYSWDRDAVCPVQGRMFVGDFEIGYFVTPSVLVGGGTAIGFNTLPANACDFDGSGLRLAMSFVVGPELDWYPLDRGFHVAVTAGYASFDQDSMTTGHGVGGSLAVGYDWAVLAGKDGAALRMGVLAQATALRTTQGHAAMMPALLFTIAFD